jgi:hypothetical protein
LSLRARRVRRGCGRRQDGELRDGPVLPGRVHDLRQLPGAAVARVHLRVRAKERQGLQAPHAERHQLQLLAEPMEQHVLGLWSPLFGWNNNVAECVFRVM